MEGILFVDHSCPTDSRESRMEGMHRTSVSVNSTIRFCESRTDRGRSPTATQGRGFPSTPDTDSEQGRTFTKSCMCGWM
eukprot:5581982-Pleurochrysis_carterae.AAC.1